MRKQLTALVLISLLLMGSFVGCGAQVQSREPHIARMNLTTAQEEIVALLSPPGRENHIFEYRLDTTIEEAEFWVEIYHYGELVETRKLLAMHGAPMPAVRGERLVLTIDSMENRIFRWTLQSGGAIAFGGEPWLASESSLAHGFGPMLMNVRIEDGQDIVLHTAILSNTNSLSTTIMEDPKTARQTPELLAEYTYVHFVLARFSS